MVWIIPADEGGSPVVMEVGIGVVGGSTRGGIWPVGAVLSRLKAVDSRSSLNLHYLQDMYRRVQPTRVAIWWI